MPFTKHIIEPTNISQCPLPPGEPNELECLSNLTLANVIRQLSSLGKHAGRIFDDLTQDAVKLNKRTQTLNQRIDNLKSKCLQLDIQNEEVSLHDFQTKKQFKSSIKIDQQVVSRRTMPEAIKLMYEAADPPPSLDKLNPYRNDGKDCMKFYTDPEFFFNIWCNELMKDNETRKIEKKKRRTKGEKQNGKSPQQQKNIQQQENSNSQFDNQLAQIQHQQQQQQQQMLLINQTKLAHQQPNLGILSTQTNMSLLAKYSNNSNNIQSLNNYPNTNGFDDQLLPPPPQLLSQNILPNQQLNNYQIYAESTSLNNGQKMNKINIQQANVLSKQLSSSPTKMMNNHSLTNGMNNNNNINGSERPIFPPPPVPDNRLSDLQQIQQQLIRKYDVNGTNNFDPRNRNSNDHSSSDLPPPPSPPTFHDPTTNSNNTNGNNNVNTKANLVTISMNNLTITQNSNKLNTDLTDSMFDMPLPPPPLELQDNHLPHEFTNGVNHKNSPSPQSNGNHAPLPPPPPLPPLVESDTASSSTSSLNAAGMNGSSQQNNSSKAPSEEPKHNTTTTSSRSYLDDINKRRYVLKPTQKSDNPDSQRKGSVTNGEGENGTPNGRDTIQPFVNNSDVAAIIDFIRKFRPHVCDSSDDEENSDWDE